MPCFQSFSPSGFSRQIQLMYSKEHGKRPVDQLTCGWKRTKVVQARRVQRLAERSQVCQAADRWFWLFGFWRTKVHLGAPPLPHSPPPPSLFWGGSPGPFCTPSGSAGQRKPLALRGTERQPLSRWECEIQKSQHERKQWLKPEGLLVFTGESNYSRVS